MAAHAKSEAESLQRVLEMVRVIDETRDVRDRLLLAAFAKEQQRELGCPCLNQSNVVGLVRVGIDRCKQPVTLSIDANHRLVNRDLIRSDVAVGL